VDANTPRTSKVRAADNALNHPVKAIEIEDIEVRLTAREAAARYRRAGTTIRSFANLLDTLFDRILPKLNVRGREDGGAKDFERGSATEFRRYTVNRSGVFHKRF